MAQFDGAAEFYVERLEDFQAALTDEDYLKVCLAIYTHFIRLIHRFVECSSGRVQIS